MEEADRHKDDPMRFSMLHTLLRSADSKIKLHICKFNVILPVIFVEDNAQGLVAYIRYTFLNSYSLFPLTQVSSGISWPFHEKVQLAQSFATTDNPPVWRYGGLKDPRVTQAPVREFEWNESYSRCYSHQVLY